MFNWNRKEIEKTMSALRCSHTGFFNAYKNNLEYNGRDDVNLSFSEKVERYKLINFTRFKDTDIEKEEIIKHYYNAITGNAKLKKYLRRFVSTEQSPEAIQHYKKLYFTEAFYLHYYKRYDDRLFSLAETILYYRHHHAMTLMADIANHYADVIFPLSPRKENNKIIVNRLFRAGDIEAVDWMIMRINYELAAIISMDTIKAAIGTGNLNTVKIAFYNTSQSIWFYMFPKKLFPHIWAAGTGNLAILDFVWQTMQEDIEYFSGNIVSDRRLLRFDNYRVARKAIFNGDLATLNWLSNKAGKYTTRMLSASGFSGLLAAVANGQILMFEFLWRYFHEHHETLLTMREYLLFYMAVKSGNEELVRRIWELSGEHAYAMLQANEYAAFRVAVKLGHINIINILLEFAGEEKWAMLKAENFGSFRLAPKSGKHEIVELLWQAAGEKANKMLRCGDIAELESYEIFNDSDDELPPPRYFEYEAFINAAGKDRLVTMCWLWGKAGADAMTMLLDSKCMAFAYAVEKKHFRAMAWLWEKAGDNNMAMLRANGYAVFEIAEDMKTTMVLEWLWDKADEDVRTAVVEQGRVSRGLLKELNLLPKTALSPA